MRSAEVGRGAGWGRASRWARRGPFRWVAGGRCSDGCVAPVARDLQLRSVQAHGPRAHGTVETVLDPILLVVAGTDLRPEVRDAVIASELQRDEMVDLVAARHVRCDPVLGIHTPLDRFWDVANGSGVTGGADLPDRCPGEDRARRAGAVWKQPTDVASAELRAVSERCRACCGHPPPMRRRMPAWWRCGRGACNKSVRCARCALATAVGFATADGYECRCDRRDRNGREPLPGRVHRPQPSDRCAELALESDLLAGRVARPHRRELTTASRRLRKARALMTWSTDPGEI